MNLTIVGLGPAGRSALAPLAWDKLTRVGSLILRTGVHPAAEDLRACGAPFVTLDHLYELHDAFSTLYPAMAQAVLEAAERGDVVYAVPGSPLIGEESVRLLILRAQQAGIEVEVIAATSFIEPTLAAAGVTAQEGLLMVDALTEPLPQPRPDLPTIVYQLYDSAAASRAKLWLLNWYPPEFEVALVQCAGMPGCQVTRTELHRLDRLPMDHLTTLVLPALPAEQRRPEFQDLVRVMARLRGEGGCPWDREQTHTTLKRYMVEECYEAIEAIDTGDMDQLCEELGDVLLQTVFHAQLAQEEDLFDIRDVIEKIVTKLIRRHPHVFGDISVEDSAEVLRNWEQIKREEKPAGWRRSALDGIPRGLPALMQAMEVSKRAAKTGFEWPDTHQVMQKVAEELAELQAALALGDTAQVSAELGDLLFTLVNVARWQKLDAEDALRAMVARFNRRFRHMEQAAEEAGTPLQSLTAEQFDTLWNSAKSAEAAAR